VFIFSLQSTVSTASEGSSTMLR